MTEPSPPTRVCRWCNKAINTSATVCSVCANDQRRWLYYGSHVSVLVSIGLLIIAAAQFDRARYTLAEAHKTRNETRELAIASAEILTATVASNDGTIGYFEIAKAAAPYVRHRVDQLLDTLNLTDEERSGILELRGAMRDWSQAPEGSQKDDAKEKLFQLFVPEVETHRR